jgi:hypothetical protein
MGNVADAANFFIESPTLPLMLEGGFDNPADFLFNVSANLLRDSKVIPDPVALYQNYIFLSMGHERLWLLLVL